MTLYDPQEKPGWNFKKEIPYRTPQNGDIIAVPAGEKDCDGNSTYVARRLWIQNDRYVLDDSMEVDVTACWLIERRHPEIHWQRQN